MICCQFSQRKNDLPGEYLGRSILFLELHNIFLLDNRHASGAVSEFSYPVKDLLSLLLTCNFLFSQDLINGEGRRE